MRSTREANAALYNTLFFQLSALEPALSGTCCMKEAQALRTYLSLRR